MLAGQGDCVVDGREGGWLSPWAAHSASPLLQHLTAVACNSSAQDARNRSQPRVVGLPTCSRHRLRHVILRGVGNADGAWHILFPRNKILRLVEFQQQRQACGMAAAVHRDWVAGGRLALLSQPVKWKPALTRCIPKAEQQQGGAL